MNGESDGAPMPNSLPSRPTNSPCNGESLENAESVRVMQGGEPHRGNYPLRFLSLPTHNMQIDTKWNSGNFTLEHSAEVSEKQMPALASLGLLYLAQRNRKHDEVLGAFTKVNGKNKRKEGWKRSEVAFAPELAKSLVAAYGDNFVLAEGEGEVKLETVTIAEEYIRDTADSKFTEERAIAEARESLPNEQFDKWVEGIKAYGKFESTHTADGEDYSKEFLSAIRARKLEVTRASLKGV